MLPSRLFLADLHGVGAFIYYSGLNLEVTQARACAARTFEMLRQLRRMRRGDPSSLDELPRDAAQLRYHFPSYRIIMNVTDAH